MPEVHQYRKGRSQPDPDSGPYQRFAELDRVRPPVKDTEVERQHRRHKKIEKNPENQQAASMTRCLLPSIASKGK
jgi:hypothetical protein